MEVLASADEAMPALAERLAGVPPSLSTPSAPSYASAPSEVPTSATQLVADKSRPVSAPAAKRHAGVPRSTSAPAVPSLASAPAVAGSLPLLRVPEEMHPSSAPAAERPAGVPPAISAPAVFSHSPAAPGAVSAPEQRSSEVYHLSAPAATPLNGHAPTSEQAAVSTHTGNNMTLSASPEQGAEVDASACSTAVDKASPRQAIAPAAEAGDGLRIRPMSSAALSESPAALAMPAREELAQK